MHTKICRDCGHSIATHDHDAEGNAIDCTPTHADGTSDEFRAYDTTTEWRGPVRSTAVAAAMDADEHNEGCARQGGYGSAIVVRPDPEAPGRIATLDGAAVWPPRGHSTGSARWTVQS